MANAFHKSNLGRFGDGLNADMNGYVPMADCGPWELSYDHGSERTHDEAGNLTEYGEWWESDRWPEIVAAAVEATERAEQGIAEWRS